MDLAYNFLSDAEPTDAQLEALMREVAEDARKRREKADKNFWKLVHKEVQLAAERSKNLLKKQ